MGLGTPDAFREQKKNKQIDREPNTPLFLLRAVQLGLSMSDLDLLTIGMVNDMITESANDGCEYNELATQEDFDRF